MKKLMKNKKWKTRRYYNNEFGYFDTRHHYNVFKFLHDQEELGIISNLQRRVEFTLVPSQRTFKYIRHKYLNSSRYIDYSPIVYVADYTFDDEKGDKHIVDCKQLVSVEHFIHKKLMRKKMLFVEEWFVGEKAEGLPYNSSRFYIDVDLRWCRLEDVPYYLPKIYRSDKIRLK